MRVVLLATVATLLACTAQVDLPWGTSSDLQVPDVHGWPGPSPTPTYRPPIRTWNSWEISVIDRTVLDTAGTLSAKLELFQSAGNPDTGTSFDVLQASSAYPEPTDEVGDFRTASAGETVPHVTKNLVARGLSATESNTPEPTGVFDLQFFPPPQSSNFATVAFTMPTAGTYSVSGIAFRHVRAGGDGSVLRIYDPNAQQIDAAGTSSTAWATVPKIDLGVLTSGDHVYFSVGPNAGGNNTADATELTFSIRREP